MVSDIARWTSTQPPCQDRFIHTYIDEYGLISKEQENNKVPIIAEQADLQIDADCADFDEHRDYSTDRGAKMHE